MILPKLLYGHQIWAHSIGKEGRLETTVMLFFQPLAGYSSMNHIRDEDIETTRS